jgi:hypothetical protein
MATVSSPDSAVLSDKKSRHCSEFGAAATDVSALRDFQDARPAAVIPMYRLQLDVGTSSLSGAHAH